MSSSVELLRAGNSIPASETTLLSQHRIFKSVGGHVALRLKHSGSSRLGRRVFTLFYPDPTRKISDLRFCVYSKN